MSVKLVESKIFKGVSCSNLVKSGWLTFVGSLGNLSQSLYKQTCELTLILTSDLTGRIGRLSVFPIAASWCFPLISGMRKT